MFQAPSEAVLHCRVPKRHLCPRIEDKKENKYKKRTTDEAASTHKKAIVCLTHVYATFTFFLRLYPIRAVPIEIDSGGQERSDRSLIN